ncbi:hypothetical protein LOTGIDRAFT_165408 [Lottia gigantea]|uniref:Uncharacterized protein n=1 Tax=Lottia gigantea TaxID=225164 RepID=V4BIX8_LOTGI|nr:hypothetical protein LOTGIDRAFT_165408 [Lottia gigantea]ESO88624.1 hypothetical protein LOTGIDRAFT_165408 [Lottia gigantea]
MAAETSHFRLPPTLNITDGNVAVNHKKWKRQVEVYLMACGATEKSADTQVAIILNCAGGHILDIFDQFQWDAEEDKKNTVKLFQKLEEYLTGKLQELLLREENLDLTKAVKICRAYEQSNKHVKELRETLGTSTSTHRVNRVYKEDRKSTNFPSKKATPRTSSGNTSSSANQKPGQQRRGDRTYNVMSRDGAIYRRNRIHIRPTKLFVNIRDKSPIFDHDFDHTTNTDEPVVNPGNDTMHNDIPVELSNSSAINDRPKRAKPPKY